MDRILSGLSTMTHPSWVAPQAWLGYIELDKAVDFPVVMYGCESWTVKKAEH